MALKLWYAVVAVACGACGGKSAHSGEPSGDQGNGGRAAAPVASPVGASASPGGTDSPDEPLVGDGAGGVGAVVTTSSVPLVLMDGWVDGMTNVLGIQGAMFGFGDTTTRMSLTEDHRGSKVCIKGTAALVDLKCTPAPPARDCSEQFFGALIKLNLNQQLDPMTGDATVPLAYDASRIKAFAFTLEGTRIPDSRALRFNVEGGGQSFCNSVINTVDRVAKPLTEGENQFALDDLVVSCWKSNHGPAATTIQTMLIAISWQVVTNEQSTVPFDFCISNVRAITD